MEIKPLYVIRWYSTSMPKRGYEIHGIDSNGKFFGSVRRFDETGGDFVQAIGNLTAHELASVIELVERIRGRSENTTPPISGFLGVLADGPMSYAGSSSTAIIYRASVATKHLPSGKDFARICEIIQSHMPE